MKTLWRYARQIQVLGEPAQHALGAAHATIAAEPPFAAAIEGLYLTAAGVGALAVPPSVAPLALALNEAVTLHEATSVHEENRAIDPSLLDGFVDDTAAEAALGALRALASMRAVLGPR